ncbi:DUF4260 family protein [Leucobacter weissii]|uniref:DUF4260 family protein n=1 Tax=Leucobacter weissii TaxID=1983706 RepID=A0A939MK32_9MICO|nr:DUF4260 family protein [Leucobacter weissii]MBO1902429.1 DUF4260 family protein [Leucobacter weissii]
MIRILWSVLAVALLAFAIFEGVKYGWVAATVLILFGLLPDIALIGAFGGRPGLLRPERVGFYNFLHRPWLPIALIAASLILPLPALGWGLRGGLELFLAGLAWLAHIAVDRAFGFGLRDPEGSIRPVGGARSSSAAEV